MGSEPHKLFSKWTCCLETWTKWEREERAPRLRQATGPRFLLAGPRMAMEHSVAAVVAVPNAKLHLRSTVCPPLAFSHHVEFYFPTPLRSRRKPKDHQPSGTWRAHTSANTIPIASAGCPLERKAVLTESGAFPKERSGPSRTLRRCGVTGRVRAKQQKKSEGRRLTPMPCDKPGDSGRPRPGRSTSLGTRQGQP